ncbi:MAG: hypothetical protein K5695_05890 [Oscillospiraceae bacterium]|nr:hypothetical protein [Oscillospiraceae bacterium]
MLLSVLTPLIAAVLFYAFGNYWLTHVKNPPEVSLPKPLDRLASGKITGNMLLRITGVTAGVEVVLFVLLHLLVKLGMYTEESQIPAYALLLTAVIPFAAAFVCCFMPQKKNVGRFLLHLGAWLAVLLCLEVCLFNGKSFTSDKTATVLTVSPKPTEGEVQHVTEMNGEYIINGDAELELSGIPDGTHGIIVRMDQEQEKGARLVHTWLDMKDDNFRYSYSVTSDKFTMGFDYDATFSIDPYGSVHGLLLHIGSVTEEVTVHEVAAVSALPFRFSALRWLLLLFCGALLIAVLDFRLWEMRYTRTIPQRVTVCIVTALCVVSTVCFWAPGEELQEYKQGEDITFADPYTQTFDAFRKGQVYLDIDADPGLAVLENVYDNSERKATSVEYRWDTAYKNGKYYSYFGVTPILVLYYPVYFLTGKLPTVPIAVDVFATLSSLLLCLTILAAVRLLVKQPNLLLLLLSLPTAVCTSSVYTCLQYTDKYYVAVSSGMCFLLLTLWLGFWACRAKKPVVRCILLACSGLSMALCAGARPTMAISTAVLVPFFLGILLRKSRPLTSKLAQLCSFTLPLLAGICGLFAYNNARFGSPFDFGAAYQLTVSDVHANTLRLGLLPAAVKQYLLQAPFPRTSFPFFEPINSSLRNYGRYLYTDATYGALSMPALLLGTLLLPLALRRGSRQTTLGITTLQKRAALVVCFAVPVLLAWMDLCIGGVNQRYVTDILPLLTIGAVVVMLRTVDVKRHLYRYGIVILSLFVTMGMIWLLMIGLRDCTLLRHCPNLYDAAEDALIFWH